MAIQTQKLRRQDGIIGGVAGGLGAFFGLNPWIFRLLFLAMIPLPPMAGLIYVILWLLIPRAR